MTGRRDATAALGLLLGLLLMLGPVNGCGLADGASSEPGSPTEEITVAAAANLRPVFEELGRTFTAETGIDVTFSFGSSGQLREQIINGAAFDLFASADVESVDAVIEAGRGQPETKNDYAYGRLALVTPRGTAPPETIEGLADPSYRRIAIANPEIAPYGVAAVQALEAAGVHDEVETHLIYGENVSDTLSIVESGNVDAGIVALSLVLDDPASPDDTHNSEGQGDSPAYQVMPTELHEPIRQALVVTSTGRQGETATAFADLVLEPTGRRLLDRYGYVLPDKKPRKDR